ncbi:hypothetical protein BpHYR1_019488 [Brachionus plicatilis]|uniref:Uncharacterized protein n=1 Tax=Brachionus plicatilis TaxID=10195 RepID=A0A3M7RCN1_BRAPC|nr:hypothetical protein BpHYR1_019488 [Brachionus plicatilis]
MTKKKAFLRSIVTRPVSFELGGEKKIVYLSRYFGSWLIKNDNSPRIEIEYEGKNRISNCVKPLFLFTKVNALVNRIFVINEEKSYAKLRKIGEIAWFSKAKRAKVVNKNSEAK